MSKKLDVTTGKTVNYEYDSLGRLIHSYQTDNGTIQQHTEHLYDTENRLVSQAWTSGSTNHVMDFAYDNTGKPYAVKYDNQIYYYVLNFQGGVIAIVTTWGAVYGTYTYDAWGNVIAQSGSIASINPIRYRGYYYDSETGLYYLGSRYYDPAVKRFMNADGAAFATINPYSNGLTDKNYFAYCDNNPVSRSDDGGEAWLACVLTGAAIGLVAQYASDVVSNYKSGARGLAALTPTSSGRNYVAAAVGGAVAAIPGLGGAGSAAVAGAAGNVISTAINGKIKSAGDLVKSAAAGAAANVVGYAASKFMAWRKAKSIDGMNRTARKQFLQERFYGNKHRYVNSNLSSFRRNPISAVMSRYKVYRYGIYSSITSTIALTMR